MNERNGFFYLNGGNQWPQFQLHDLEVTADGSLHLKAASNKFVTRGLFVGGPFEVVPAEIPWYRLQAFAESLHATTHLQIFTFTAESGTPPFDKNDDKAPFPSPDWHAEPRDVLDVLIQRPAARQLWIGGVMRGDGVSSPVLHQIRVDYGRDTYLESLPAIYGEDKTKAEFLERFLSLEESVLGGLQNTIVDLPRLFDPESAPGGDFPSWLTWLAGWLAWDLNEHWSEAQARSFLAGAFALYGKRGTLEGLRRYLKVYAGVSAHISEPAADTSLWSLGESSTLGFTTMLAPAAAQGAVLDSTATIDRSHLTTGERFGAALFEDLAHRFCVQLYCAELMRRGALEDARAVLDREKPAHTQYHLCVIEPRMRVGAQARVGIDAIVADGPPPAHLGGTLDTAVLIEKAKDCEKGDGHVTRDGRR